MRLTFAASFNRQTKACAVAESGVIRPSLIRARLRLAVKRAVPFVAKVGAHYGLNQPLHATHDLGQSPRDTHGIRE